MRWGTFGFDACPVWELIEGCRRERKRIKSFLVVLYSRRLMFIVALPLFSHCDDNTVETKRIFEYRIDIRNIIFCTVHYKIISYALHCRVQFGGWGAMDIFPISVPYLLFLFQKYKSIITWQFFCLLYIFFNWIWRNVCQLTVNNPLIFLILSKTGRVANYLCIITCIFNNEIIKNKTMSMYWILFIGIAIISYIVYKLVYRVSLRNTLKCHYQMAWPEKK